VKKKKGVSGVMEMGFNAGAAWREEGGRTPGERIELQLCNRRKGHR